MLCIHRDGIGSVGQSVSQSVSCILRLPRWHRLSGSVSQSVSQSVLCVRLPRRHRLSRSVSQCYAFAYRDGIGSADQSVSATQPLPRWHRLTGSLGKARLQRCASSIIVRTPWGVARRVAPVVVVGYMRCVWDGVVSDGVVGAVIVVARAVVARRVAPVVGMVRADIDAMGPVVVMIAVVVGVVVVVSHRPLINSGHSQPGAHKPEP